MSEKYPEVLGAQMHDVNLAVVAEVKNLRSQVAREAIKLMRTLFKNLDKRMDMVRNNVLSFHRDSGSCGPDLRCRELSNFESSNTNGRLNQRKVVAGLRGRESRLRVEKFSLLT